MQVVPVDHSCGEGRLLFMHPVLRVSALHYSAGDWVSEGFWTVASACVLNNLLAVGLSISNNQCPQVLELNRNLSIA